MRNKKRTSAPSPGRPSKFAYQQVFAEALDNVLEKVFGRAGTSVIASFVLSHYHLEPIELADRPNEYMSAMQELLGTSAQMIERSILDEVRHLTNVSASTLAEATMLLKKDPKYGRRVIRGTEDGDEPPS